MKTFHAHCLYGGLLCYTLRVTSPRGQQPKARQATHCCTSPEGKKFRFPIGRERFRAAASGMHHLYACCHAGESPDVRRFRLTSAQASWLKPRLVEHNDKVCVKCKLPLSLKIGVLMNCCCGMSAAHPRKSGKADRKTKSGSAVPDDCKPFTVCIVLCKHAQSRL